MHWRGGDRESHQRSGQFSGRGNCSVSGLHPFPIFSSHIPISIHPFLDKWLTWHAGFSLGHSLRLLQIITWHLEILTCERVWLSRNTKKNNRDWLWPWKMNMTSACAAACHLNSHFVFSTCFLLANTMWHNEGEKDLRTKKEGAVLGHLAVTVFLWRASYSIQKTD